MTSSTDIVLPLPADVDVSDMPHMPLFDSRLVKSRAWLRAKNWRGAGGPGLGFVLVNLWAAAFRTVPAGSLEDDDDLLADNARCDIDFWHGIKKVALQGWQLIDGRWWHPVVAELAFDLWKNRLRVRHEKAHESYRSSCRRAADKGIEPPLPIGNFLEWRAAAYPATDTYLRAIETAGRDNSSGGRPADKTEKPADFGPKGRTGKVIPPCSPPSAQGGRTGPGKEAAGGDSEAQKRRQWFATERGRLYRELGDELASTIAMHLQRPREAGRQAVSGDFGLVQTFKGSWLNRENGELVIVMPSRQRADATWAANHEWLSAIKPAVRLRHATVAEKRLMGQAGVA